MKLKFYLRGLGAGVIITALLFSFVVIPKHTGLSDEEIIQKAKELGMVEQEDKSSDINSDSWKRKPTPTSVLSPTGVSDSSQTEKSTPTATEVPVLTATEVLKTPTVEPSPTSTVEPSPTSTVEPSPTPTVEPSPTPTTKPTPTMELSPTPTAEPSQTPIVTDQSIVVNVVQGMSSEELTITLNSVGVINDFDRFNTYLIENGYAEKLRIGSYHLKASMSYQEIAEIVTRR